MLSESERRLIESEWSGKKTVPVPNCCFPGLFERQVERNPATVAVEFGTSYLTYRELNERSNQLARHLLQFGVGPEVLVAIYLTRSIEMVVAILATWKAGGAYVACDPQYPMERIAFMLDDTGGTGCDHRKYIAPSIGSRTTGFTTGTAVKPGNVHI